MAGGHFIVVRLPLLAARLKEQLSPEEIGAVVGVGDSGTRFARMIRSDAPTIDVTTLEFNRDRSKRELHVQGTTQPNDVLVDDIGVSGTTIEAVRKMAGDVALVAIGLLYDSSTTRRRMGIAVRAGVLYTRTGGGTPPINSISSLRENPERLDDLASRYFTSTNVAQLFKDIIRGEDQ